MPEECHRRQTSSSFYRPSPQDTIAPPIERLIKDTVVDVLIGAGPRVDPKPPGREAEAVVEGCVVGAPEEVNAVEFMPPSPESARAEFEKAKSVAANELGSGDTASAGADGTTPAVVDDMDRSFESDEIVELGEAQPTAGGTPSDAGPETGYDQPFPEVEPLADGGVLVSPAAPGAVEKACIGDMALTPTESADAEAEQVETAAVVEVGSTASAMLDAEAPAHAPEGSHTPATGGLASPDAAAEGTAPQGDGQPFAEKKQKALFGFFPKLLGWGKKEDPRSRVALVESATQAAGGEEAAGETLVSTAPGDHERQETAAQVGDSALDGQMSVSADVAAMMAKPLEDMTVPAPASGGVAPDTTEKKRLSHEAGDGDHAGGMTATATAPLATKVDLEEPTSSRRNLHRGFSLPMLFGWGQQHKTSSRAVSLGTPAPQVMDDVSSEGTENQPIDDDDEFSIAGAMMSAEGVSGRIETVPGSTETVADERLPGDDVEGAELATTQGFAEVSYRSSHDLEKLIISRKVLNV